MRGREVFAKYLLNPLARALVAVKVPPAAITLTGLAGTLVGSLILAAGHPVSGAIIIGLASLVDGLDGTVARLTDRVSRRGAFLDTVSDRVGEAAMFAGLAWFVAEDQVLVTMSVAALALAMLIPYLRGKAAEAGVDARGGWMGRAERVILFCFLIGPVGWDWWGPEVMLIPFIVLTGLTVVQRFWKAWSQISD